MPRYTDVDALIADVEKNINTYWNEGGGGYHLAEDVLNESIKTAPIANVVEVKYGQWIEDEGYYEGACVCSNCGEEAKYISTFEERFDYDWEENLRPTGYEEIREYIRPPYCPNCGAKMDGKEE